MHKKFLIVAAISSRPYVTAAIEAGFDVVAIDAFADVDTLQMAKKAFQVDVINGQFELKQILNVLGQLDLHECAGFCYGAGFELEPEILTEINKWILVIGNTAEAVKDCKNPQVFFEYCAEFKMLYPEISFEYPNSEKGWVVKSIGASGGAHIRPLSSLDSMSAGNVYYQKIQTGKPVSCLFLANGKNASIIGYNEQWCAPEESAPYRYGGAVSHAEIDNRSKEIIEVFVQAIVTKLGLRGINSCDFIFEGDQVFALEINPRLSATLDLYRTEKSDLFAAHMGASLGGRMQSLEIEKVPKAHQVIYAKQKTSISNHTEWPSWVCDIPQAGSIIETGMPICTVVAKAPTAAEAKQVVMKRAIDCVAGLC